MNWPWTQGFISGLLILFHWSQCLFCWHHIALITVSLSHSLKVWCLQLCAFSRVFFFHGCIWILGLFVLFPWNIPLELWCRLHWIYGLLWKVWTFDCSNLWAWSNSPFICLLQFPSLMSHGFQYTGLSVIYWLNLFPGYFILFDATVHETVFSLLLFLIVLY